MTSVRLSPRGLALGAAAFTIWGLFPAYLHPLSGVPAIEIIAHRIVWSCVFLLVVLIVRAELWRVTATLGRPRLLAGLAASALLISCNWLVYVWSVTHQHIVESSLGYYINPLVNVLLGVLVLRERPNVVQWTAIALAAAAVLYLAVAAGRPPWIAFALALSFSLYGFVRKVISVDALPGLATETLLLLPPALGYLLWCQLAGVAALTHDGPAIAALLVGSGIMTAVPLFLFAYAARLLPYSTVGVLQYIGPSLQLAVGVLFYHEAFGPARGRGFALLWAALVIYAADGVWRARRVARTGARGLAATEP
ncbi:MAG TPA: EamA family transporter RarD [Steroidobacteraceae bacterium]|nr:EamA family transporter RarD [Steroidobacteraceae bacterium]